MTTGTLSLFFIQSHHSMFRLFTVFHETVYLLLYNIHQMKRDFRKIQVTTIV